MLIKPQPNSCRLANGEGGGLNLRNLWGQNDVFLESYKEFHTDLGSAWSLQEACNKSVPSINYNISRVEQCARVCGVNKPEQSADVSLV
jgi:hypothetical protein